MRNRHPGGPGFVWMTSWWACHAGRIKRAGFSKWLRGGVWSTLFAMQCWRTLVFNSLKTRAPKNPTAKGAPATNLLSWTGGPVDWQVPSIEYVSGDFSAVVGFGWLWFNPTEISCEWGSNSSFDDPSSPHLFHLFG